MVHWSKSMDLQSAITRLTEARDSYHWTGESELTDDQYDALREYAISQGMELSNLSPPPKGTDWPIINHDTFMPSIPLAPKSEREFQSMIDGGIDHRGTLSYKYDGIAMELQYRNGELQAAVLRGDGHRGENVMANAMHVPSAPKSISTLFDLAVFGELVVSWNNFKALNQLRENSGLEPYRSPRNAVAIIRSKTARIHWCRLLAFRPYGIHPQVHSDFRKELKLLKEQGFNPVDAEFVHAAQVPEATTKVDLLRREGRVQYQLDGTVYRSNCGALIKYKFPASSAVSKVVGVIEQVSRTGIIAPVVEIEPVVLDYATVRRASGHNADLMSARLHGLGPGAVVLVSRRGAVIPHLEEVVSESTEPWTPTNTCPSCDGPVVQTGSVRRCGSDYSECPGTYLGLIIEFCRRMGMEGFGPGVVTALMSSGLVRDPADLFTMDPEDVADAEQPGGARIGEAIAGRLCRQASEKERTTWGELLGALCVQGCAKSVMQDVAWAMPDPDILRVASRESLLTIDGIGPERADSILAYVDTHWDEVVAPLLDAVSLTRPVVGSMSDVTVCVTLALKTRSRAQMEALVRHHGGDAKSSVSRRVTHLVCNTPDETTTKLTRAKELGIPIISEQELIDMMGAEDHDEDDDEVNPDDDF